MTTEGARTALAVVRERAYRLTGAPQDYDPLVEAAAGKTFVLIGESTHGTQEYYRIRAEITQRLVTELGFDAIAIEGDWPDAWCVNSYVTGDQSTGAEAALGEFRRFPEWMWRNREVLTFVRWLQSWNQKRAQTERVGFYGLDLYSLYRSAEQVIAYLETVDPEQAEVARQRYATLDHVRDAQAYGYEAAMRIRPSAAPAVRRQLDELRSRAATYCSQDGLRAMDAQFAAECNAAAVVNAESYYRAFFGSRVNTWNLRDRHMRDTLLSLHRHRCWRGGQGRTVVWAHNSHVGDARATEMHLQGEWNLGQLIRMDVGDKALLVGFTTYTGQVTAASEWGGEAECKQLQPALPDSYEQLFHATHLNRFYLPLDDLAETALKDPLLERAVGVIYLPRSERQSHYFHARLPSQFDAIFHLDETQALEPIEPGSSWAAVETPAESEPA